MELQGLIQTPGVGRQTFNTTSLAAAEGYPSGAAYFRYTWAQLEPRKGEYNWALIDKSLAEVRMQGRTMDIGPIMLNDDRDARWTPQWMRDKGLVVWPSGGIDWASADLLANHRDFILDFAARYDGHPDISSIDIRSIGAWGEWHQYNDPDPAHFPSWDIQKQVIDLYYSSFKKTPLVMLVGGREKPFAIYAANLGRTAWRGDCWGDSDPADQYNHHDYSYTPSANNLALRDAWTRAPVALEACLDPSTWKEPASAVLADALSWHASVYHTQAWTIPVAQREAFEAALLKLGFRLILRRAYFPARLRIGSANLVSLDWENVGVAPPYRDYRVGFRLRRSDVTAYAVETTSSVKGLLPGAKSMRVSFVIPSVPELMEGETYSLEVGLLLSGANDRKLPIAIEGKTCDGWYPLATVKLLRVLNGPAPPAGVTVN
ncbi:MAG: DUF4832 domain-containing protein [Pseudomonadales bacterium]|nr:DUF4832 domain-containing protein [Pseudomonadales bacterium]MCP5338105.1 DUF4832 domain-containing protein [Pseudomonadales bacterium]